MKASELVKFAQSKLGTPYVYGMKGAIMTKDKFQWLKKTYPSYIRVSDEKKIGKVCVDCSGLISWATGKQRNSTNYKSTATKVLTIDKIAQAVPGCAVWRSGHIGIYIGNGKCIEARGSSYGTVETKVAERDFTHILWLCDIDYTEEVQEPVKPTITSKVATKKAASKNKALYDAEYKVSGCSWLNVRNGAGVVHSSMVKIPKDTKVRCFGFYSTFLGKPWLYVQFTYKNCVYTGFASSTYLKKV